MNSNSPEVDTKEATKKTKFNKDLLLSDIKGFLSTTNRKIFTVIAVVIFIIMFPLIFLVLKLLIATSIGFFILFFLSSVIFNGFSKTIEIIKKQKSKCCDCNLVKTSFLAKYFD